MKELGSCEPPISSEHIVSKSVCQVFTDDALFSISGVPWLKPGETKVIPPLEANCLCRKHNSALSPLDSAAKYFFSSLKSFLVSGGGTRHALLSGHDLERWLLKTAKAAAVSGNLGHGGKKLPGSFSLGSAILEMLDEPLGWPEGAGLYCIMSVGDLTENSARFQLQPLTNENDAVEALFINFMGFRMVLLLEAFDVSKYPFLAGAIYRPGRIAVSYPASTSWVTLSWGDHRDHTTLTVQLLEDQRNGASEQVATTQRSLLGS